MELQDKSNTNFKDLKSMTDALHPYISIRALARIVGMNENLLVQYSSGKKTISQPTIDIINKRLSIFADELKKFKITRE